MEYPLREAGIREDERTHGMLGDDHHFRPTQQNGELGDGEIHPPPHPQISQILGKDTGSVAAYGKGFGLVSLGFQNRYSNFVVLGMLNSLNLFGLSFSAHMES